MKTGNPVLNRKRKAIEMDKRDIEINEDGWNRGSAWSGEVPHRTAVTSGVDNPALRGELTFDDAPPFEGAFIDREASDTLDPVEVPEPPEAQEGVEGTEEVAEAAADASHDAAESHPEKEPEKADDDRQAGLLS